MVTAYDLLVKKPSGIWSVAPDATVLEALKLMDEANTGALLVMSLGKVDGIVSERDCIRKVDLHGRSSKETLVKEIMTEKVMYVEGSQPLEEVMALMTEKSIRHMPVYQGGNLVGVISIRDVLREMAEEQKFLISQLEKYITSG